MPRRRRWRDVAWLVTLVLVPLIVSIGLITWEHLANTVWGLAIVAHDDRIAFLAACAGAAGALLGFVIATMALLVGLPDSPRMSSLRSYSGWRVLEHALLAATLNLLVLLTASLAAIIVKGRATTTIVTVYGPGSVAALALSGLLFALVLLNIERDRAHGAD